MMQVGSATPAQNLHNFQAKPAAFRCRPATLRPITKPLNRTRSIELTRQHLSNLEKLLQKSNSEEQEVLIKNVSNNLPAENKPRGWLDGLSLARIWEEAKAAEEMSPRNLNRLQRLLSMSAERSPRNDLGSRWREYHGCNDWAGLIDPLNENLRREVVRYGEFVQAAYNAFHSDPATSPEVETKPVVLPDRSYKVTKSLYATSSVGLPKWVDDVAPDLGWMTQRTSWIGYVAVCDDKKEIQRMGRRDIVIALRGTATCHEWAENVRAQLVEIPNSENPAQKVECGFLNLHKTPGSGSESQIPSLADSVVAEIRRLIDLYKGETLSITITGHSLGAALALLVGDELATSIPDLPPVAVFSFGGPKVGNQSFADRLSSKSVKVLRIVNNQDIITRVPGLFVGEEDYSHVGTELKVDTKMSPYLKPNADVACCHDLEAYLHLVDGFLASNRPFRADAKRSLVKLLKDQGSNVKKLYTSRAKSLSLNPEKSGFFMAGCLPSPSSS